MKRVDTQSVSVWARRSLAVLLVMSWAFAATGVLTIGAIPMKYIVIGGAVYTIAVGVLVWALLRMRTLLRGILLMGLAMTMTLANTGLYAFARATDNFITGVQQPKAHYIEYVITAKKDHPTKLEAAQTVAMIDTDPLYGAASRALHDEISAQQKPYAHLLSLTEAMASGEVELGAFRKASLDILQDNSRDFYQSLVVLGTFRVKAPDQAVATADVTKPFVVYISGIDTYGEVSEVSRSDVNILAVVNPGQRSILLVNTPRDYYVQLHGTEGVKDKLTHAGIYGVDMSRQTMEDLYGVAVPYYIRMNFTSLVKLIDTIGPIEVYSDYAFKSYREGLNTLNSKQALEFARERYSFEAGDRQRGRNQQRVIEAIIAKIGQPQYAVQYPELLGKLQDSLQTNLGKQSITQLASLQFDDLRRWTVSSIDVDGAGTMQPTYSMGPRPLYVMIPGDASLTKAKQLISQALK